MQSSAPALVSGLPFVGMLASMAALPVVAPRFWHRRMAVVAAFWIATLVALEALAAGPVSAAAAAWRAMVIDYLPFMALMLALYTAAGGILLRGAFAGTPAGNTSLLVVGMVLGLVMGTTGASMVLIHPLLRANAHRRRKVHLVLFLIVLVANASGALTPLGNPPLYLGLLHGVPFFWPARHLAAPLLIVAGLLLVAFYLLDRHLAADEPRAPPPDRLRVRGWGNVVLILLVVVIVLAQGLMPSRSLNLLGQSIQAAELGSTSLLLLLTVISSASTARAVRQANDFSWHPMIEVAILFAALFITIAPVERMLEAGLDGPLVAVLRLTRGSDGQNWPMAYFWLTGILSAFLDNAPTYLVFFRTAGIQPSALSDADATTLAAISAGAVFFGGLTYIGNAPNMMLRAIAAHRGVRMPSFFGFLLMATGLLLPVLGLVSLIFFSG